jgi:hypothetical protein
MEATADAEAGDIWDDVEGWAARNGYPSPRAWAAEVDRAAALSSTGTRPRLNEVTDG